MASNWLPAVLPASQMPDKTILTLSPEEIHVADCDSREVEFHMISFVNIDSLRVAQKCGGPGDYGPYQRCKHCQ